MSVTASGGIFASEEYQTITVGFVILCTPFLIPIHLNILTNPWFSLVFVIPTLLLLPMLVMSVDKSIFWRLIQTSDICAKIILIALITMTGLDVYHFNPVRWFSMCYIVFLCSIALLSDAFFQIGLNRKRVLIVGAFLSVVIEISILVFSRTEFNKTSITVPNLLNRQYESYGEFSIFGLYRDLLITLAFYLLRDTLLILRGKDRFRFKSIFEPIHVSYSTIEEEANSMNKLQRQVAGRELTRVKPHIIGASQIQIASGFFVQEVETDLHDPTQVVVVYCDRIVIREKSLLIILIIGSNFGQKFARFMASSVGKKIEIFLYITSIVIASLSLLGFLLPEFSFFAIVNIISTLLSIIRLSKPMVLLLLRRIDTILDISLLWLWFLASSYVFYFDQRIIVHFAIALIITRFLLQDARFNYPTVNQRSKFSNILRIIFVLLNSTIWTILYRYMLIVGSISNTRLIQRGSNELQDTFDPTQFAFTFGASVSVRMLLLTFRTIQTSRTKNLRDIQRPVCYKESTIKISTIS